jgi:asparagine synthase (glutamine-hydrolysing)
VNQPIARVINLIADHSQHLWSGDLTAARRALLAANPTAVLGINGSFALVAQDGERVVLVRSLERPLRYFLAKATDGPVLIVAERIDEMWPAPRRGWADQFHPSYAHGPGALRDDAPFDRMPRSQSSYRRFFDPPRGALPPDGHDRPPLHRSTVCGARAGSPPGSRRTDRRPLLGRIDSSSVLLCLYKLLDAGCSPLA